MNLVNGVQSDAVSVRDRGLMYGDGVFRTFPLRGGKPVLWPRQYAKLAHDCAVLQVDCPPAAAFEQDLAAIAATSPDCVVKIIVTRGESARGYAVASQDMPTRIVRASPLPAYPGEFREHGVRVHLCRLRLARQPALAGIKHLNRLENVLGRAEWSDPAIAEGLMCDSDDAVIGGTMSNLFVIRNGRLLTPDLAQCGVEGVTRGLVIDLAATHGIPLQTAVVGIDELLAADEMFLVNSVIGLWPVTALDRRNWQVGALTKQMRHWIDDAQGD
jgi:4-amino-4-deoxychorismate lyase